MQAWAPTFLEALATCPNVSAAAKAAGINRQYAYEARDADPAFAAAWQDAIEQSTDSLVGEMYRRAIHGTEKPVYQGGMLVGTVTEYSDTLAIFLAKSHRREVYGDRQQIEQTSEVTFVGQEEALARIYGNGPGQLPDGGAGRGLSPGSDRQLPEGGTDPPAEAVERGGGGEGV